MLVPILQKISKKNDVLLERVLPKKGDLDATIGQKVEPFTRLGITRVSYGRMPIGKSINLSKGHSLDSTFYTGEVIGTVGGKKIVAPFDGIIVKSKEGYMFEQEERDYWLLAGVWGEVVDSVDKHSVILKTQVVDIHFANCTKGSCDGELIVFPNPSELLEMQYLERFSKDSFGKVVYTGNYVSTAMVERAHELGIVGVLAGSTDREAFVTAKRFGIFLGSISGFGKIPTPSHVYEFLKDISNRYVFLQGDKGILRIPVSSNFADDEISPEIYSGTLKELVEGSLVQVFEEPYFGWVGKVSSVHEPYVYVILDDVRDPVKIRVPNILAVE